MSENSANEIEQNIIDEMNSGKTMLVSVLIKAKLVENSDEYAILKNPFAKKANAERVRNEK